MTIKAPTYRPWIDDELELDQELADTIEPTHDLTWRLQLYVAESRDGGMVWSDELPHRYVPVGDELELKAATLEGALSDAFTLANIGTTDDRTFGEWVASYRDRDGARSLSVGDVVTINGEAGRVCAPLGWRELTRDELVVLTEAVQA